MSDIQKLEKRVANLELALNQSVGIFINIYGGLIALRWRQQDSEMDKKLGEEIEAASKGLDELIQRLKGLDL
jgi:hypothetical protein